MTKRTLCVVTGLGLLLSVIGCSGGPDGEKPTGQTAEALARYHVSVTPSGPLSLPVGSQPLTVCVSGLGQAGEWVSLYVPITDTSYGQTKSTTWYYDFADIVVGADGKACQQVDGNLATAMSIHSQTLVPGALSMRSQVYSNVTNAYANGPRWSLDVQ